MHIVENKHDKTNANFKIGIINNYKIVFKNFKRNYYYFFNKILTQTPIIIYLYLFF